MSVASTKVVVRGMDAFQREQVRGRVPAQKQAVESDERGDTAGAEEGERQYQRRRT